jgi:transcriptional repressor NrdR
VKCPFCNSPDTQVIDSRVSDDGDSIRRRRKCAACNKRFTTYETVELRMPQVVKQDGSRAEFDLDKLRTGFMRALHKRPVPTQLVDEAIATVTQDVLALGEREIESRRIGEMVMRELRRLDQVAYIRFASVYRSFEGVDDFEDASSFQRPQGEVTSFTAEDHCLARRGAAGAGSAAAQPQVGCVIVREERSRRGLARAGRRPACRSERPCRRRRARGATAISPACVHQGAQVRAEAVGPAARVVAALEDPNPLVAGGLACAR